MRLKKCFIAMIYLLMLLICAGIVWFLGPQRGAPGSRSESAAVETEQVENQTRETTEEIKKETAGGTGEEAADRNTDESPEEDVPADSKRIRYGKNVIPGGYGSGRNRRKKGDQGSESPEEEPPYEPPKLMFVSDLHYMSSTTHDDGEAFWKMVEGDDGKTSQYSDELLETLVETVIREKPSALVLSGDMTLNGERENHQELAKRLRRIQEAGVPVAVIPGNHDINHPNAAVYFGKKREAAETLQNGEEFLEIYHEFGYDQAPGRDPASLSYVYAVDAGHWLLMLDSCQYEPGNQVNGRIRPETLAWLEACLKLAQEHDIQVLPVAHHNLLSESRLYTTDCTIENHDELTALLEMYQVPLFISGHLHAQRVKTHQQEPGADPEVYGITEIVLSPVSLAPNQYGMVQWDLSGLLSFETRRLDLQSFAVEKGLADENLLNFDQYGVEFLKTVRKAQVMKKIYSVPDDLKAQMASVYAELYYDYCAGNRIAPSSVKQTAGYRLWERAAPDSVLLKEMKNMMEDAGRDHLSWTQKENAKEGETHHE